MKTPILSVNNLSVMYPGENLHVPVPIIKDISFNLYKGETLGIIGESGSGKSITLLSLMGLIDIKPGIINGSIILKTKHSDINLLEGLPDYKANPSTIKRWQVKKEKHYQAIRGNEISMIFQNPKLAFNPYFSIGSQINEMIRLHTHIHDKKVAKETAINWLRRVHMEAPALRYNSNPYGLSGGMCQRGMIAMALSSEPSILIADEPTTGLDATIQLNIVNLLKELKSDLDLSMIVVSHDFKVMRQLTDRVVVYYKGRIIEQGQTSVIFEENRENIHPYTKRLLAANLRGFTDSSHTEFINNSEKNGCDFFNFCTAKNSHIIDLCENKKPELSWDKTSHGIRCWKFHND